MVIPTLSVGSAQRGERAAEEGTTSNQQTTLYTQDFLPKETVGCNETLLEGYVHAHLSAVVGMNSCREGFAYDRLGILSNLGRHGKFLGERIGLLTG